MLVVAKASGFYDGKRRRVGEFFEVKQGLKGSWFDPVASAKSAPAKGKVEEKQPETFSELNKVAVAAEEEAVARKTGQSGKAI